MTDQNIVSSNSATTLKQIYFLTLVKFHDNSGVISIDVVACDHNCLTFGDVFATG